MACTLSNVIAGAEQACNESFSGIGSRIYIALASDLTAAPSVAEDKAEFTAASFASLSGKLKAWDIEEETGEVTAEANAGGGGFTNKCEVTVRKGMHEIAHELRILNNVKFLVFVPDGKDGYYVFYSVMGSAKLESLSSTTGKAATDEHGHTVTISAGPMYYPQMRWYPTTAGSGSTQVPVNLDTWCTVNPSGTSDDD